MNLLQLRTEALVHGFDAGAYGARINQYINDAIGLIVRRVDYYVDEAALDFNTVSGTALYPQPADFARDRSLRDTVRGMEMQAATLREMDRSVPANGAPTWYAVDGVNLHLYPTPDTVYSMELRYWKIPAALSADTDVPTIPDAYQPMLVYWALKRCYAGDDDIPAAQYWEGQFNTLLAEFAADVKFPSNDAPHQLSSQWEQGKGLSRGWTPYGSTWG